MIQKFLYTKNNTVTTVSEVGILRCCNILPKEWYIFLDNYIILHFIREKICDAENLQLSILGNQSMANYWLVCSLAMPEYWLKHQLQTHTKTN